MIEKIFKHLKGDRIIWMLIFILFITSLLAVYSATGMIAYKYHGGNTFYYLFRHIVFLAIGFIIIYITHRIPYKVYFGSATIILGTAIVLLAFTLLLGVSLNEARRWLTIPIIGMEFQTSDLGKFALIVFTSKILSEYQKSDSQLNSAFKIIMIASMVVGGLILPANLSTTILLMGTIFILMFIGRINGKYLLTLIITALVGLTLFVLIVSNSDTKSRVGTWTTRFQNFANPESEGNYQVDQSKIAIATGGFFGKGPGNSVQRNVLPHPYSDFIYAIIIEEYGAIGGIGILLIYLIILFRTGIIVRKLDRTFPAFLTIGLVLSLVFQALINMAVAVNLFPVTGQPLPFVSMGGTSILFSSISIGIILNISRYSESKESAQVDEEREYEITDYPFIAG